MRILGAADLHIGAAHVTNAGDQQRALDAIVEIARDQAVDVVLLAGDLTHHRNPTTAALEMLGGFFTRLAEIGVSVVAVGGNHDPGIPGVARHFRGHVHVASEPRLIQLDGLDVAAMPFLPDSYVRAKQNGNTSREDTARLLTDAAADIIRGLSAQRRPGVPLVFVAHGTVAGSVTSSGYSFGYVGGTEWRIAPEDLADFDLSVVGHVHKSAMLGDGVTRAPVLVPGSLLPLDFSETGAHGAWVADVVGGHAPERCEFVPVPTPRVATWDFDTTTEDGTPEFIQLFTEDLAGEGALPVPELLRVRVHCDEATAREYPPARISAALYAAGARLVQVELDVAREDRARDAGMTSEIGVMGAMSRHLADAYPDEEQATRLERAAGVAYGEVHTRAEWAGGTLRLCAIDCTDFLGIESARLELAPGDRIVALTAPVGTGKSALGSDAIRAALFGTSRAGARASDALIRNGADVARAAVEIEDASGRLYRIVRTFKRETRGRVASQLDVLESAGVGWRPLSDGKKAAGQAAVDHILGGLTDPVLTSSNIVIQREGDLFVRARPEDRKRLIAEAAALGIYDELVAHAQDLGRLHERELARLHASAEPLRARVAQIPDVEETLASERSAEEAARAEVARLEREHAEATRRLETGRERRAAYDALSTSAREIHGQVEILERDLAEWGRKKQAADRIVAERKSLVRARAELEKVRAELDATLVAEREERAATAERSGEIAFAQQRHAQIDRALFARQRDREGQLGTARAHLEGLRRAEATLPGCVESCMHFEDCAVVAQAETIAQQIGEAELRIQGLELPTLDEADLASELAGIVVPDPLVATDHSAAIAALRARAGELEKQAQVAEKIAAAEAVLAEHDEAVARIHARSAELRRSLADKNAQLLGFGGAPEAEVARAEAALRVAADTLARHRRAHEDAITRIGTLAGRLATLQEAREELAAIERSSAGVAVHGGDQAELVRAWRAVRVAVLENGVIPQIEDAANELLRRFPYGLQIALRTQRERKSGDGTAEALDIEVLGGLGPVYEMCSGGQRTALDTALHLALALVVSRRSSVRLSVLSIDEPEGLDEAGRAAFAAILGHVADEYGLQVICMSHHADLIDALGARVLAFEGVPGASRLGAAVEEREVVAA